MGLAPTSYMLLMTVRFTDEGALSLSELGRALMVHPATVTILVDQLEKDELLERRPNPRDRRATLATLTAKGRRQLGSRDEGACSSGLRSAWHRRGRRKCDRRGAASGALGRRRRRP